MNYYEIAEYNPILHTYVVPDEFVPIRILRPLDVLSKNAISKFDAIGLTVREVQLFTTQPNKITGIHTDGHDDTQSKGAVNYVIGGGSMVWYRLKNDTTNKLVTPAGTSYMLYELEKCTQVDELKIEKLSLVRTNIPHNILNTSDHYRYCFSIRFNNNNFEDIFEKLKLWHME